METKAKKLLDLCEHALAMKDDYDFGNLRYLSIGITGYISKRVVKELKKFQYKLDGEVKRNISHRMQCRSI